MCHIKYSWEDVNPFRKANEYVVSRRTKVFPKGPTSRHSLVHYSINTGIGNNNENHEKNIYQSMYTYFSKKLTLQ